MEAPQGSYAERMYLAGSGKVPGEVDLASLPRVEVPEGPELLGLEDLKDAPDTAGNLQSLQQAVVAAMRKRDKRFLISILKGASTNLIPLAARYTSSPKITSDEELVDLVKSTTPFTSRLLLKHAIREHRKAVFDSLSTWEGIPERTFMKLYLHESSSFTVLQVLKKKLWDTPLEFFNIAGLCRRHLRTMLEAFELHLDSIPPLSRPMAWNRIQSIHVRARGLFKFAGFRERKLLFELYRRFPIISPFSGYTIHNVDSDFGRKDHESVRYANLPEVVKDTLPQLLSKDRSYVEEWILSPQFMKPSPQGSGSVQLTGPHVQIIPQRWFRERVSWAIVKTILAKIAEYTSLREVYGITALPQYLALASSILLQRFKRQPSLLLAEIQDLVPFLNSWSPANPHIRRGCFLLKNGVYFGHFLLKDIFTGGCCQH